MSTMTRELRARNLRTLAALAALFLLPLVIAFWMYYVSGWRPAARVNHGELISPMRPLPPVQLPRVSLAATPPRPFHFGTDGRSSMSAPDAATSRVVTHCM